MIPFIQTIVAEFLKQYKSKYHSWTMLFSMFLWPILNLTTLYYIYKPFSNIKVNDSLKEYIGEESIFIFILIGHLSFMFFSNFINTAWDFSKERIQGTLEMILLTPASRFGVLIGNALSSLIESIWLLFIFSIFLIFFIDSLVISNIWMVLIAILSIAIPSICWGVFLNSIFIFTRDTRTFFSILYQPLELLSGVKFPFSVLPLYFKMLGYFLPLTWSLSITRDIFMKGVIIDDIITELTILILICFSLLIFSYIILNKGERYILKKGNANLF